MLHKYGGEHGEVKILYFTFTLQEFTENVLFPTQSHNIFQFLQIGLVYYFPSSFSLYFVGVMGDI